MLQKISQQKHEINEPFTRQRVNIPIEGGQVEAEFFSFHNLSDGLEHIAIGLGPWQAVEIPMVRLHSECLTGDVFGSAKCDCGPQLKESIAEISKHGGFLIYLRQEGRGIGLYNKLDAYKLQQRGFDTFSANRMLGLPDDSRNYKCAAEILSALDVTRIKLLSNNPEKANQLERLGIKVNENIRTGVYLSHHNYRYLDAKVKHTRHSLELKEANK